MKKLHYSWCICLVCVLLLLCNSGMPANILPVYLPFLEELGYSGTQSSALVTIRCFTGVVGMLVVTQLYQRISLRVGLTLCCTLVGGAFLLMSTASGYWAYVAGAAMLGVSYGLGAIIPVSMLIGSWFVQRRATALALCTAGTGVSAMLLPPMITQIAQGISLRAAFCATGALAFLVVLLSALVIRDRPEQLGMTPYGAAEGQDRAQKKAVIQGHDLPRSVYWAFLTAMVLFGGASMASYSHYAVHFTTAGHSKAAAALCCSLQGGVLVVSKCLYGMIVDRIGGRRTSLVFLALLTLGCGSCALAPQGAVFMYLGAVLMGIGFPPASVGITVWAAEFSSQARYASVVRSFQMAYTLGGLLMTALPGWIYDRTGSYSGAYDLFTGILALFTLVVMWVYACSRRQERALSGAGATEKV